MTPIDEWRDRALNAERTARIRYLLILLAPYAHSRWVQTVIDGRHRRWPDLPPSVAARLATIPAPRRRSPSETARAALAAHRRRNP